ncbi:MAG: DUF1127 domain-containing protein [Burkholderiales bacterium]
MNEALNIGPSSAFDEASLSTLRRVRGDTAAANEDASVELAAVDIVEAWARHASAASGFGDAMLAFPVAASRPAAHELERHARFARAQAIGGIAATFVASTGAALRRAWASYRAYRAVRQTMWELRGLDDRMLRDLGFHRSEIESVAIEVSVTRAR